MKSSLSLLPSRRFLLIILIFSSPVPSEKETPLLYNPLRVIFNKSGGGGAKPPGNDADCYIIFLSIFIRWMLSPLIILQVVHTH